MIFQSGSLSYRQASLAKRLCLQLLVAASWTLMPALSRRSSRATETQKSTCGLFWKPDQLFPLKSRRNPLSDLRRCMRDNGRAFGTGVMPSQQQKPEIPRGRHICSVEVRWERGLLHSRETQRIANTSSRTRACPSTWPCSPQLVTHSRESCCDLDTRLVGSKWRAA